MKSMRLTVLAASILTMPALASADEIQELRTQIQKLSEQLERLQARQDEADRRAAAAAQEKKVVVAKDDAKDETKKDAADDAAFVRAGDLPNSFKVPGTETSIKIGGMVVLDVVKDFDGGGMGGSLAMPQGIALPGLPQHDRNGQLSFSARRSRLNLETLSPTRFGNLKLFFEGDFYGAGGNEYQTNSAAFRLRQAFAEIGPWTIGQAYTTFWEPGSYAEQVDFDGGQGTASVPRQPLIRYTRKFGDANEFSIAVENPSSEVDGVPSTTFVAGIGPVSNNTVDKWPDLVARYVRSGDWGRFGVAGLVRRITVNNLGQDPINGFVGEKSVTGYGLLVMGSFNTWDKDSVQYSLLGGPGAGRYILGNPASASVVNNGDLEAIDSWGAQLSYQRVWDDTWRSNIAIGTVKADYPHPAVDDAMLSRVDLFWLNHIWNPSPAYYIGVEWLHGRVKADAISGDATSKRSWANRLEASFRYTF